jgi:hypothetical protein
MDETCVWLDRLQGISDIRQNDTACTRHFREESFRLNADYDNQGNEPQIGASYC